MCNDDRNIDGGQKDALLRRANIKKIIHSSINYNNHNTEGSERGLISIEWNIFSSFNKILLSNLTGLTNH